MTTAAPKPILSGRVFSGQLPLPKADNIDALARFSKPAPIAEYLREQQRRGINTIITMGEEKVVAALRLLKRGGSPMTVLPVIPNVPGYVREATEYGLVGAGIRRLVRVGPLGFFRAALVGARNPFKVLKKDFPTMLQALYEIEMGEFGQFRPPAVFLHHQMTDLFLSFQNRQFFADYERIMRRRFKTRPALATSNFPALAAKLKEWNIPIRIIAAPLNPDGFLMPGGLDAYREHLDTDRFILLADRTSTHGPTTPQAQKWCAQTLSVKGIVCES